MDTETPKTRLLIAESRVCAQLNQGRQSGNQTAQENIVAQIQSTVSIKKTHTIKQLFIPSSSSREWWETTPR